MMSCTSAEFVDLLFSPLEDDSRQFICLVCGSLSVSGDIGIWEQCVLYEGHEGPKHFQILQSKDSQS